MADQKTETQSSKIPFGRVRTIPGDIYQWYQGSKAKTGSLKPRTIPGDVSALLTKGRREQRRKAFIGTKLRVISPSQP